MKSKWYELKENAIKLRQQGFSIGKIERDLGIPRSTLSGWLKNIKLTARQKELLEEFARINGDETAKSFKDKLKDLFTGAEK